MRLSVVLSAAFLSCASASGVPQERIVGGAPASISAFPFYAYVQVSHDGGGVVACGGTVVSSTAVVTAAHCFDSTSLSGTVYLGLSTKTTAGQVL